MAVDSQESSLIAFLGASGIRVGQPAGHRGGPNGGRARWLWAIRLTCPRYGGSAGGV